jgi:glutamate-ammonia-ligase adenylyltransferase
LELLFLYSENGKTSGSNSVANQDFFDKVIFLFRKNFKAKTDGIFELDLRLRPYGVDGSLSNSFNSWKQYLLEKAHPIEIQSCTRLRIIQCSNDSFKNVLLDFVDDFVYKPIDKLAFLEMRAKQLQSHVKKENNAKYSPGALADLEYTIQHYQLKHAKNIPELKHGTILDLLRVLLQNNLVSIGVFENLSKVYAFYRRLINALRLAKGNAKDLSLPNTNSPDMRFLLKRMGYVENQKDLFWQTWSDSLKSVGIFFDYFFHGKKEEYNPKGIALAISKGFDGDTELLGNAFNISNGDDLKDSFVQLYNSSLNSELLLGLIVESAPLISESANPQKLARFFVQYSREAEEYNGLLSELLYHPNMLRLILLLGDLSDFFANILIRHPRMVLKLLDTGELNQRKNKSHFDIEIKERLKSSIDEKFVLHRLVRYRNREYLRIILRDFHLGISQEYITAEISDLTGALFRGIYNLNGKKYPNTLTDQSVLAFGKWGAKELNYSSDIDITFVKSNTCMASLDRENKSLLRLLSSYTPYGQLFRVDTTLRPYGQQGNLVAT